MTEDEMAGWHHWLDGHEFQWTPGVGDGQGSLACFDSWGRKESDTTEQLNWTELSLETDVSEYQEHLLDFLKFGYGQWSKYRNVAGKSQFWPHVGIISLICFSLFFVIIIIPNGLPQRTLPLCLTVKLKCFCSGPCLSGENRKEKFNTSPPWGLSF